MPIIKSAKRAMKKSEVKRQRNFRFREKYKEVLKNFKKLIKAKEMEKAKESLNKVYSVLDMAVKKKILHKNNVAHKKSGFTKMLTVLEVKK